MKVLFFFEAGFDTPGPSNHLMNAMLEDTLNSDISVHMIESHTTGRNTDIPENLAQREHFTYDIVPRKYIQKQAFAKRYMEGILYAVSAARYMSRSQNHDVIFIQSSPTVLYNILVAKFFGKKKPIIYNIQDMFPGSSVHSGVMTNSFMQKFFYLLQKIAYKCSDYIVVISEDMKQRVIEQGVSTNKIMTIVNWYNDRTVHEIHWKDNRFVKKYNLNHRKFYIQYAGTLGYVFDYKMVLKVAELLKEYRDIEFQMIGEGSQKEVFIKEKEEKELDNIVFFPLETQDMVSDVYSACTICLIPLKKGIIGNSVPSKSALVMACNRAIVNSVDEDSAYYKMFNENKIGIAASNDSPEAVSEAILDLYRNKEKRESLAKNGQEFCEKFYSRSENTQKYIRLFSDLTKEHKRKICESI